MTANLVLASMYNRKTLHSNVILYSNIFATVREWNKH